MTETVHIKKTLYDRVSRIGRTQYRSAASVVNEAVAQYLERKEDAGRVLEAPAQPVGNSSPGLIMEEAKS